FEREAMLVDVELAENANVRHDQAAVTSWIGEALERADYLRASDNGAVPKDELTVLRFAATLATSNGLAANSPLMASLPERLRRAATRVAAREGSALRPYER